MKCSYVEQATKADDLPTSYLHMLVDYGGVAGRLFAHACWLWGCGRSDKREFYALHRIIGARSGSPQLIANQQ